MSEIYCQTVLETGNPTSKCWQDHAPTETCRGKSFLAFKYLLEILDIPWLIDASFQFLHLLSHDCLFSHCLSSVVKFLSSYKDTSHTGL